MIEQLTISTPDENTEAVASPAQIQFCSSDPSSCPESYGNIYGKIRAIARVFRGIPNVSIARSAAVVEISPSTASQVSVGGNVAVYVPIGFRSIELSTEAANELNAYLERPKRLKYSPLELEEWHPPA